MAQYSLRLNMGSFGFKITKTYKWFSLCCHLYPDDMLMKYKHTYAGDFCSKIPKETS